MKGRIKILSLTLMLVGFVNYIINNSPLGVEISYRLIDLDIASGGTGSGRTQIWDVAATYFINMDIVHTVFGYGAGHLPSVMSSALNNPIGAHNDWLDIAVSYGLCGLFLFLYFFISIFNLARKLFFSHDKNYLAVISCLIILLFYSAATGGVFNVTFVALFGILGFCSGGNQRLVSQALLPRSV
jgi:O-antigen ligase